MPTTPTIHLNGTGREALLTQCCDAASAIGQAIDAACQAAPNGRDYYPQGDAAFKAARSEHEDRVARLRVVMAEYEALAESISEAGR